MFISSIGAPPQVAHICPAPKYELQDKGSTVRLVYEGNAAQSYRAWASALLSGFVATVVAHVFDLESNLALAQSSHPAHNKLQGKDTYVLDNYLKNFLCIYNICGRSQGVSINRSKSNHKQYPLYNIVSWI